MKRISMVVAAAILLLDGCDLKHVLFWSPDGQHAAVITTDGLQLGDVTGKLSKVFSGEGVTSLSWFPDSKAFVVARSQPVKTWEAVQPFLTPERRDKLLGLADRLENEALAYQGNWDEFKPSFASQVSDAELVALILYLRDHRSEKLREKLGEKWNELRDMAAETCVLQRFDLSGETAHAGTVLAQTLDPVIEVRVAPGGNAIACVQKLAGAQERMIFGLSVFPASGGPLREVASPVASYPDWSPDSKSLFYATTKVEAPNLEATSLGTITKRQICENSGTIQKEFGSPDDKVGILFWPMIKIRCLKDGQVVFSGMDMTLPASTAESSPTVSLFSIDPGRRATVARVLARGSESELTDGLMWGSFEVSPDQKKVVVAASSNPNPSIVTLATGEVKQIIVGDESDKKTNTSPTQSQDKDRSKGTAEWRTSDELAIVVPPRSNWGSQNRYEYALWSGPDKARCLSCGWPTLFEEPKSGDSSPASQPSERTSP